MGSDHHLVTATLKLKLRKTGSSPRERQHFGVEKLRDLKLKTAFTLQLKNKSQVLADAEDQTQEGSGDINAKWQQLKIPYEQTCKPALEQSRGKGRSRSQRMPDKSLRTEELSRRKSWEPNQSN